MNRRLVVAAPALLVLALLAGCGTTAQDASARSGVPDAASSGAPGTAQEPGTASGSSLVGTVAKSAPQQRAIVSTGRVRLATKDVARTRSRVDDVIADHGGSLADERSVTDRKGRTASSRLVIRVPSSDFSAAMAQLTSLGGVRGSGRTSQDVTTDVIDTDQRVRAQRIGLKRVETLLGRAGRLADVLTIEQEITRRQAELDSSTQQQAYLADQTSLATLTVTIDRTSTPQVTAAHGGFAGGLGAGWHAMGAVVRTALTVLGAALPFAALLLLVVAPLELLRRRRRSQAVG